MSGDVGWRLRRTTTGQQTPRSANKGFSFLSFAPFLVLHAMGAACAKRSLALAARNAVWHDSIAQVDTAVTATPCSISSSWTQPHFGSVVTHHGMRCSSPSPHRSHGPLRRYPAWSPNRMASTSTSSAESSFTLPEAFPKLSPEDISTSPPRIPNAAAFRVSRSHLLPRATEEDSRRKEYLKAFVAPSHPIRPCHCGGDTEEPS